MTYCVLQHTCLNLGNWPESRERECERVKGLFGSDVPNSTPLTVWRDNHIVSDIISWLYILFIGDNSRCRIHSDILCKNRIYQSDLQCV